MNSNGGIMKLALVCIAIIVGLIDHNAQAATVYWGNTATDWNAGTSWVGGQVPGSGDTAQFTNTPAFQPNITTSTTISNVQFKTNGWTLSASASQTLTLLGTGTGSGAAIYSFPNGVNTTNSAPLIFGAASSAQEIAVGSGGALLISGSITKSDANNLSFSVSGPTTVTGDITAGGRVTVSGAAGGLTLSGNNSVGGWDIGSGSITLNSAGALGSSGAINWSNTGLLIFTANNNTDYSSRFTVNSDVSYAVGAKSSVTVTLASALAGNGANSGFKAGGSQNSGTIILGNAGNSFGGSVSVNGGSLSVAAIGNGGNNSYLGTNGTINLGGSAAAGTLIYTGTGETSDKVINLAGTTGGGTIQADNASGVLKFTRDLTATGAGSKTLTLQGSGAGEIQGAIVDNSGANATALTKNDAGTWTLSGTNTHSGGTLLKGGTLILANKYAIGSSNLTIQAGTIQAATDFTGANAITNNWGANSGFGGVIFGGTGSIELSGTCTGLLKDNPTTNNLASGKTLILSGPINLAGSTTNRVFTLAGSGNTVISGNIANGSTSTSAVTITSTGLTTFSGSNTYSGVTTVSGGALRLNNTNAIPGGIGFAGGTTNLVISGGVVELGVGDFARDLGTGATQVQIKAPGGGFSAFGGKRLVNLGGATNLVIWGSGSFVPAGSALILNSAFADSEVEFQNPINLNAKTNTVQVDDNSATNSDFATLSGVVTNGALVKTGLGKLVLAGATNRFTSAAGLVVSNGTLVVQGVTTGTVLTVAGGTALLNGPFTGPVRVGANGALGGTGTVAMANLTLTNGAVTATILDDKGNSEYLNITGATLNLTNLTLNVVNTNRLAYGQSYWVVKCAHSNAFIPPSLPAEWVLDYRDAAGVKIRSTRYSGTMLKIQ